MSDIIANAPEEQKVRLLERTIDIAFRVTCFAGASMVADILNAPCIFLTHVLSVMMNSRIFCVIG